MRVIQVPAGIAPRIGGPAVAVIESSHALPKVGVESTIFAPDLAVGAQAKERRSLRSTDLPPNAEGLDVRLFRTRWPTRLVFSPGLYRALGREVEGYDVVHAHNLWTFPQFAAYRQAYRHGVPYVVAPCGALDPWLRKNSPRVKAVTTRLWQRDMLDRAAVIHYKTHDEARRAAELGIAAPAAVVPNGIDWGVFQDLPDPASFRERYLDGHDGPIVMNIGRIEERKRLDVLITAFARVHERFPDVRLVLVGPDDEGHVAELLATADHYGVRPAVVFPGVLRGQEKLAALSAAAVWCLPSHFENFGLAVVEAMAAGVATVISPEVQISDEAGREGAAVVTPTTPQDLAADLCRLIAEDGEREELAERGREYARRYDWSAVAPQLADMYASAVERRTGRRAPRPAAAAA